LARFNGIHQMLAARPLVTSAAIFAGVAIAAALPVRADRESDAPQNGRVTFTRDIAPLIFQHCAPCHRPGEVAPFSLLTFDTARARATQIAQVTRTRYMPPWKPEPGYGDFVGVRRLTDDQINLIQRWVDDGLVEGDAADLPPAPDWTNEWQLGRPDIIVTMPEAYRLGGDGPDVFRSFVIPITVAGPHYVRGVELRPGNRQVVHHANIKIDATRSSRRLDDEEPGPGYDGGAGRDAKFPDGQFLGWTPGQMPRMLSDGMAWRLEPGSDLVVEAHMVPSGKPEAVQFSVGLFFTDQPPSRVPYMLRLGRQTIDIPPGEKSYVSTDRYVLPVDVDVLAVQPHAHNLARQINAVAIMPDGISKPLIDIKDWDFNWQDVYRYAQSIALPRGTTLVMRYTYDNSADNARNPYDPPRRVTFGQTTSSEMGDLWLQVVARNAGDRAALDRDYTPKMLQEDIAGDEKMLEVDPRNARVHADVALCYLEAGRVFEAISHLEQALRIDATFWAAHYELGTVLLNQRRLDEAEEHFQAALELKQDLSEAHNNLGVIRYLRGDVDAAVRAYSDALKAGPDNWQAHFNLAKALAAQGKVDEAIIHYHDALEGRSDDAEILAGLASVLATQGRVDEATSRYRRALQLNPDLPAALVDLAWILAASDRPDIRAPDEAVALAERVARLTQYKNPIVLDTLGLAYSSAGQWNQAIDAAQSALDLARTSGSEELIRDIRERLESYQKRGR
jgi:tetratricopeptide (TPR) repeat protein/mono/diheme cytochrome c family protein